MEGRRSCGYGEGGEREQVKALFKKVDNVVADLNKAKKTAVRREEAKARAVEVLQKTASKALKTNPKNPKTRSGPVLTSSHAASGKSTTRKRT